MPALGRGRSSHTTPNCVLSNKDAHSFALKREITHVFSQWCRGLLQPSRKSSDVFNLKCGLHFCFFAAGCSASVWADPSALASTKEQRLLTAEVLARVPTFRFDRPPRLFKGNHRRRAVKCLCRHRQGALDEDLHGNRPLIELGTGYPSDLAQEIAPSLRPKHPCINSFKLASESSSTSFIGPAPIDAKEFKYTSAEVSNTPVEKTSTANLRSSTPVIVTW